MVGILVATHGGFAEGLLNAVELIAGKQEKVKTIGLYHGDGIDEFADKVRSAYEELDEGEGVLTFVDIFGGSPSNAVMKLMAEKPDMKAITGVNMPMLVEAVMSRDNMGVDELCVACKETGVESQVMLHDKYKEIAENAGQDTEDDF